MKTEAATAYAVMKRNDATARAIFASADDATAYAQHLNQTVKLDDAFGTDGLRHIWAVYPWTVPADIFATEAA